MEALKDQIKGLEEENLQVCGANLELMQVKQTLTKENAELKAQIEAISAEVESQKAAIEEKNRLINQCLDQVKVNKKKSFTPSRYLDSNRTPMSQCNSLVIYNTLSDALS